MNIIIKNNEFGNNSESLRILLKDVHNILNNDMKDKNNKFDTNIKITHNDKEYYPIIFYDKEDGCFLVNLGLYDKDWARYTYQFAHEYCHIRTNYIKGRQNYLWFEETICEVASHYALRKMSIRWLRNPPYKSWKNYAKYLKEYSDKILSETENLSEENLKEFIQNNLSILKEGNPCNHRKEYKIIAKYIITYFENSPKLWVAMTYWNKWEINNNDGINEAFGKWLSVLPENLKEDAEKLIKPFQSKEID